MRDRLLRLSLIITLLAVISLSVAMPGRAAIFDPTVCADFKLEQGKPDKECLDMMAAFPEPVVVQIERDGYTLSNYSFWQVTHESPNMYDSPGGNVLRQMPAGFNFVRALDTSIQGWVQVEGGEWMSVEDVKYYQPSEFRGVTLLSGLEHPFGWVMDTMYTVPYPGAQQSEETGRLVRRYDRVNIFAETVDEAGWKWYMVGPDQWIEQRLMAIAKQVEKPEEVSGRWVAIDLYEQTLVAYEENTPVFATLISSGLPGWDTNEGLFKVWASIARDRMAGATGAPDAYALQSVPWVMYFDGGISLHGTYWHDGFGYRHSHGCVNLTISDAHFIFDWMSKAAAPLDDEGKLINYVYVHSSGEYRKSGSATK